MKLEDRLIKALQSQKKKTMSFKQLEKAANIKKEETKRAQSILSEFEKAGTVIDTGDSFTLTETMGLKAASVVKLGQTFGFARADGDNEDTFIPGRCMKGAMVGDRVLLKPIQGRGSLPEAEVVKIVKIGDEQFTGVVVHKQGRAFVMPDKGSRIPMEIAKGSQVAAKDGEKVLAFICKRGESHFEHRAQILQVFGSAESAGNCCKAILSGQKVTIEFPAEVLEQAREIQAKGIHPAEIGNRVDLRKEIIFTIDGADSKDLDDAVSLEKTDEGYSLGVHIADVSYYVGYNSAIDKEAYDRGTSIYYANKVVPMLPEELSNGICSLNPNEDRLTFSALIKLSPKGDILSYEFKKTVIRSAVKGVYSEINSILMGSADETVEAKYSGVKEKLLLMQELGSILAAKRYGRGGMELESTESKIVLDEKDRAVDILPREQGISEGIIEEFMLTANTACAMFGDSLKIPFIYRVHDNPPEAKIQDLKELLTRLGISTEGISDGVSTGRLAKVLKETRGTQYAVLVNNQILRSMAKAEYSHNNVGHYGLVLGFYTHFTSPIRRYPDLIAHRELTLMLTGGSKEKLCRRYEKYLPEATTHCTGREIRAMQIERSCDDFYKAEYMQSHIGESFKGVIGSVTSFGMYVQLANTVEGLLRTESLGDGEYIYEDKTGYTERYSGKSYRVGDAIEITVSGVDVAGGKIDFVPASIEITKDL